jgi:hypothetical protein
LLGQRTFSQLPENLTFSQTKKLSAKRKTFSQTEKLSAKRKNFQPKNNLTTYRQKNFNPMTL